ncbi:zinc ribbon domain-containing protein [cf. Phormidesmis sp. LEGE 11477]|uniref:zinc ribbon domain-containing protein n=1 Tax=cf. Phormidesmis sp. LEGE 11477 TaxID=1828680 RepID=UPI00187EA679|nr:zinc ribbon domain-containing protein [cf. Phormidesmis sp. LEGE 11477]MBE9064423.1 zinc ribbon domain-containing protein [cf. Phormidesmis sp. LEGE 11477]
MAGAVSYRCDLGNSQELYLSNQGILTTVTIYTGSAGQQQQSSQAVATGEWKASPQIYRLGGGYVATVFAEQTFYLSIQGNQMQMSSGASGEGTAQQIRQLEPLPMQPAESPSVSTMKPMTPMQPMTMTMGDMSMSMGEMRMGNMSMGTQASSSQASSQRSSTAASQPAEEQAAAAQSGQKKFCSQCGAAVRVGDRFCAQCGTQLTNTPSA